MKRFFLINLFFVLVLCVFAVNVYNATQHSHIIAYFVTVIAGLPLLVKLAPAWWVFIGAWWGLSHLHLPSAIVKCVAAFIFL